MSCKIKSYYLKIGAYLARVITRFEFSTVRVNLSNPVVFDKLRLKALSTIPFSYKISNDALPDKTLLKNYILRKRKNILGLPKF